MTPKKTNFDRIARMYDRLAALIFGKSISHAQLFFLSALTETRNILVLGGGTGKFLPSLLQVNSHVQVWYIDSSAEMVRLARQRTETDRVHFIHGTEQSIPSQIRFDAALTFFYLDLFGDEKLLGVVKKIKSSLTPDALWLVADFTNKNTWWAQFLLNVMYPFFRWTSGIEASRLPDWPSQLSRVGFHPVRKKLFYSGFIESSIFRQTQI